MVQNIFRSTHIEEQHLFFYLRFLQFLLLTLPNLKVFLAFLRVGIWVKSCFLSTHIVQQLLFSMFDFDLILGSFLIFLGPNGLFSGLG